MSKPEFDVAPFLTQAEGQHFDRKSMLAGPRDAKRPRKRREVREQVAEYVAAFANADGGVLLLGVEDDGEITGHRLPPKAVESILDAPRTRLDPPQPRGFTVSHGGVELIVFDVPAEDVPVQMMDNGFPLRVGDQTRRARETQIAATKQQGMYESWESRRSSCSPEALDPKLLAQARAGAGLSALSDEEYLLKRKLADQRGNRIELRRAAELLFARFDPDHPNAGVRVFRVIGTDRRFGAEHNVEERPRIEGSLPGVLYEAHGVVAGLLRRPSRLVGMRFQEMPEYPDFAWREALHNAVAHRDYAIQGSGIEIWLFEDRMEVVSAGDLPEGVSLEDVLRLERVHRSRNPRIVRVLVDLGFAKDQGEGIPRMFAEMEDAFLPRPEVAVRAGRVIVTLRNTSTLTASDRQFVANLGDTNLSREEFRALLMAHRRGQVDNAALRSVTGLDTLRASALLRGLRDRELLALHARGGDSFYTLTPAVREHVSESRRKRDRKELSDGSGGAAGADRGEPPADRGEPPADRGEPPADRGEPPADRGEPPADRGEPPADRGEPPTDRGEPPTDRGELPTDLRRTIDGLGSRPRKERLRDVIEAICAARGWTTSGDIARFLHFSQRKLSGRHLTPMVEAGRLVRRYPGNPTHPDQAYRAASLGVPSDDETWVTHAPFRCLGRRNGSYYYLPQSTGRVERIRVDAHTKSRLLTLAPSTWWETHFPGFESGNRLQVLDALFRESRRVGVFYEDAIRGRGCRRRQGGLLVHLGDRLYPPASSQPVDPLSYDGDGRVYERRERIAAPAYKRPLDSDSAKALLRPFTEIDWKDDFSAYLLAGWTVLAPFCGALRWRPHVWLTAVDGLPDSIVGDLIEPLLAGSGLRFDGRATRSRLLKGLDGDVLPILYGGTTSAPTNRRHIRGVLQLAETASSSRAGVIGHGTPQGRPVMYRMRSMFCFFGLDVGRLRPDRSRISILELRNARTTSEKTDHLWRAGIGEDGTSSQLGTALAARTLPWLHDGRLDALIGVCRDAATTVFRNPRKGDQYGTLVAGVWLLLADQVPNRMEVTSWLSELIEDGRERHE